MNLVPSPKPQDVYTAVCDVVKEKVRARYFIPLKDLVSEADSSSDRMKNRRISGPGSEEDSFLYLSRICPIPCGQFFHVLSRRDARYPTQWACGILLVINCVSCIYISCAVRDDEEIAVCRGAFSDLMQQ